MAESSDANPVPPPVPLPMVRPSAHASTRPVRADASGVSMAWKVVYGLLAFFIGSGAVWTAFGLATLDNLGDHNTAHAAHQVVLDTKAEPVPVAQAVKNQHAAAKAHQKEYQQLKEGYEVIVTVKIDLETDRAERLADRAADKIRNSERSREVWKTVRDAALQNLRAKPSRPIRAGLGRYLD